MEHRSDDFPQLMAWFLIAWNALLRCINSSFGAFLINGGIQNLLKYMTRLLVLLLKENIIFNQINIFNTRPAR